MAATHSSPLVLGVTGASGAIYARRLLQVLLEADREVHLAISPSGQAVFEQELGVSLDLQAFSAEAFLG
ncbi:3-octaprenyl-4-hydroxybenzoate carboxy-lyase, partial [bacterium]|nr:3-octaprenyl-4-hydroxybenzoate carboxy-lyase [bacterium]